MTDDDHGQDVWPAHDGPPLHANVDRATLRQCFLAGFDAKILTIASDERKVFLGLGAVRFSLPPDEAAARFARGTHMNRQYSYVVCIVGGRHEYFASPRF